MRACKNAPTRRGLGGRRLMVFLKRTYLVEQDARAVRTKAAKTFRTYFLPIGGPALNILAAWVDELTHEHLRGAADPLFPATAMGINADGAFVPAGLAQHGWASSDPVREIARAIPLTPSAPGGAGALDSGS